jgi:hypothetical protein
MKTFSFEKDGWEIRVDYNDHDVNITDVRHREHNSITLTREELAKVVAGIIRGGGTNAK